MPLLTREIFSHRHAFFLSFVGEHRTGDNVTNGVDARKVGEEVGVDDNATTLIEFEAGFLSAETAGIRLAANRHKDLVSGELKGLTVAFGGEGRAAGGLLDASDLGAEFEFDTLFLKSTLGRLGGIGVVRRAANGGEHFHHGDLGAEAGPN